MPIAVSSKQVRDVLKSGLSTSVPVANPAVVVASGNQIALVPSKEETQTSSEHRKSQAGTRTELLHQCPHFILITSGLNLVFDRWFLSFSLISSVFTKINYEAESTR